MRGYTTLRQNRASCELLHKGMVVLRVITELMKQTSERYLVHARYKYTFADDGIEHRHGINK